MNPDRIIFAYVAMACTLYGLLICASFITPIISDCEFAYFYNRVIYKTDSANV